MARGILNLPAISTVVSEGPQAMPLPVLVMSFVFLLYTSIGVLLLR